MLHGLLSLNRINSVKVKVKLIKNGISYYINFVLIIIHIKLMQARFLMIISISDANQFQDGVVAQKMLHTIMIMQIQEQQLLISGLTQLDIKQTYYLIMHIKEYQE
jgi:hypothetical protein